VNRCSWASTISQCPAFCLYLGNLEPSYVLKALGVGEDLAHTSIRFGLGRFNTQEEVDYVIDKMVQVVTKLRELSPLYEMAKEGIDISKVKMADS